MILRGTYTVKSADFQHSLGDHSAHYVYRWLPEGEPRALLQIVHGMAEHAGRYARLAEALTAAGFVVIAQDLPGHGRTGEMAGIHGHLADFDGWNFALKAVRAVRERAAQDHPGLPVFLFGHSMGSLLGQYELVERGDDFAGAVLCATTADMGALRPVGLGLMRGVSLLMGRRYHSWLGEQLSFKEFNKRFAPNRTEFDWLSRDTEEVDRYMADGWCGFRCTTALWSDLLAAGKALGDRKRLQRVPKDLPICLIVGSEDPVPNGAEGPHLLAKKYRKAGVREVSVKVYDGARHELLNETCREQVTGDLRDWLLNLL